MAGASFPGIVQIYSVIGTNNLGPLPGVAVLRLIPQQQQPASEGDLTWEEAGETFTWRDAVLDKATLEITRNGHIVSCRIFDRRFWWKFRAISGVYNERRPDGNIYARAEGAGASDIYYDTEKSPQELASLLLDAMEESGYDVSALPNADDDRPFVNWLCANPAAELDRLCRERGCAISLHHQSNTVKIVRLGEGALIPVDDVQSYEYGIDVGEYPETLKVCFGRTIWQSKLKLEAVGVDTDGEIKPINDLSYKPAAGWGLENPDNLLANSDTAEAVLANSSVFRIYRVTEFSDETLVPVGESEELDFIDQIFPLGTELADVYVDPTTGKIEPVPASVEGVFYRYDQNNEPVGNDANTDAGTQYEEPFNIIPDRGYVVFDKPVVKIGDGVIEEAELYLLTTYSIRDNDTHQYVNYEVSRNLAGGNGTFPIARPDHAVIIKAQYDAADPTAYDDPNRTTNVDDIEALGNAIIDDRLPDFSTFRSLEVHYRSIKPVDVDGVTRQVTHIVSRRTGSNTRVGQNTEPEIGVMKNRERVQLAEFNQNQQTNAILNNLMRDFKNARRKLT